QNLTGSVLNTFSSGPSFSILSAPQFTATSQICNSVYSDFRNFMSSSFLPRTTSTSLPSSSLVLYGTAATPATVLLPPNQTVNSGQTITGFGTLLVPASLTIEGTVNWTGNVIVYGSDSSSTNLEVDGGLNVTGNLLIVGGRGGDVLFRDRGDVTVNGALTAITDYTQSSTKLELCFEKNLVVNGLLTALAPSNETRFDSGSISRITGSYQLGPTIASPSRPETRVRFES